ncbi:MULTISPECIES: DUF4919 domain-containing protein [Chryseobacterium]|uniref:DUF4919 domain-containing protein n=1 Tax=Chryseobacterium candidae TaxID=1978493 RepID=A0ABY2R6K8_9FLAO|nr:MULTISPECIES: DUF4919 domain-containing protein [Chryseobacterium]PXW09411.1 uncharacterized protein DUF4919 [Chryseobacterium sp. CBTAP 102]THV57828.1 DUF4919 domain-containing protein [Chryseobacterium candidae]
MKMYEKVFEFLTDPTKETFLKCRERVINDPEYDPYSEDIENIQDLLNKGKFEEVIRYNNVNILLSPRAHIYKYFAYKELGDEKGRSIEMTIAQLIFECLEKTGNGTEDSPYIITRISDERDLVRHHLNKQDVSQNLIRDGDKIMDALTLEDGTQLYFDIKVPYQRLAFSFSKRNEQAENKEEEKPQKKKWWKF